jgi:hypothetical protein
MLPLGITLAIAGYLLFDLHRWTGAPNWRAVLAAAAMSGMAYAATVALIRGARGLDRRAAISMAALSGGLLLVGLAGPLIQNADLVGLNLPLGMALAGVPPVLLLGATMVMHGLRREPDE